MPTVATRDAVITTTPRTSSNAVTLTDIRPQSNGSIATFRSSAPGAQVVIRQDGLLGVGGRASASRVLFSFAGDGSLTTTNTVSRATISGSTGNKTVFFETGSVSSTNINLTQGNNAIRSEVNFSSSSVTTGSGNDAFRASRSVSSSNVNLGAGANVVSLSAGSSSSKFTTGDGGDSFSSTGSVSNSSINLGDGANLLSIQGNGISVTNSDISTGSDNDILNFAANVTNSDIYTGKGADGVTFTNRTISSSNVNTDDGNDSISLTSLSGFSNSTIQAGTGADSITIGTQQIPSKLSNSWIDLGQDSDADRIVVDNPLNSRGTAVSGFSGVTVSNFGRQDSITIGGQTLGYNDLNPGNQSQATFKGITFKFLA